MEKRKDGTPKKEKSPKEPSPEEAPAGNVPSKARRWNKKRKKDLLIHQTVNLVI